MFDAPNLVYRVYEKLLKQEILSRNPVKHVAIVQDGNRRYAKLRGLPTFIGHGRGADTTDRVSNWCLELGIQHLTVYAFSTENFRRSEEEKEYLFNLIRRKLLELCDSDRVHHNQIRVRAIGRIDLLPECLQQAIDKVEAATQDYSQMYFNIALAYGGQCELVDTARVMAHQVKMKNLHVKDVDEDLIGRYLYPHGDVSVPKVDLIIRTGGEIRTSNFLPWQANGNECAAYFCAPHWPEFRKIDFLRAIRTAQARKPSS